MSSPLKQRLQEDMKSAMRARDQARLTLIRFVLAGIKRREIDEQITLDDVGVLAVIEKIVKQHEDSIGHYQKAERQDLVDKEQAELDILQSYMPKALSHTETETLIRSAIGATGASSMRDMGKVIATVKQQAQGRIDMRVVSDMVKQMLA